MSYYIDLSTIPLDDYQKRLEVSELLPSWQILKEQIGDRFAVLAAHGITNMAELKEAIKTKARVGKFAEQSGLPLDYVTVLRREVNSHQPPARKIADFTHLAAPLIDKLTQMEITTTVQLYDWIVTGEARSDLARELGLSGEETLLLAQLTDVCRLRYVSPAFATVLVYAGYDSVAKIRDADAAKLHDDVIKLNTRKAYYKGNIGLKDMQFLVNDAAYTPDGVEY